MFFENFLFHNYKWKLGSRLGVVGESLEKIFLGKKVFWKRKKKKEKKNRFKDRNEIQSSEKTRINKEACCLKNCITDDRLK